MRPGGGGGVERSSGVRRERVKGHGGGGAVCSIFDVSEKKVSGVVTGAQ